MNLKTIYLLIMILGFTVRAFPQNFKYDPLTTEECRIRDGLPYFFSKVHAQKEVRIAYFGGSITKAKGWRVKTQSWFKTQFPETEFVEIDAAISGTGTGFGACRISTDIIPQQPDLVFVEFRVNGGQGVEKQSVEGIVRQLLAANPRTDICFIYTISESMRQEIGSGKNTPFGAVMEEVANYYGIPSIDLGIEVLKQEQEGNLIFKGDDLQGKVLNFSRDGIHPWDGGHELYTDIITRNILKMDMKAPKNVKKRIKPQLYEDPWEKGSLIPVEKFEVTEEWELVDRDRDPIYSKDGSRTDRMLRGAYKCVKPGGSIVISWEGTTLGINDLTQKEPVVIEIQIDGGAPLTYSRPQSRPDKLYSRCMFLPKLSDGKHTAILKVKELTKGETYYVGQFLQAGPLQTK